MDSQQTDIDTSKYKMISANDFLKIMSGEVQSYEVDEEYAKNISFNPNENYLNFNNLIIYDEFYILSTEDEHRSELPSWNAEPMQVIFELVISECIFKSSFNINYGLFTNFVHFSHCQFNNGIRISNSNFQSSLIFTNAICSNFIIYSGKFYNVELSFGASVNQVAILGGEFREFNLGISSLDPVDNAIMLGFNIIKLESVEKLENFIISDVNAEEVQITKKLSKESNIIINNIKANKLSFTDLTVDGSLIINDITSNKVEIDNLQNNGILKIYGLTPSGGNDIINSFAIKRSNLGKSQFFRINFQIFNEVNIVDSYLVDTLFANIKWKDNITAYDIGEDEHSINKKEINQLNLIQRRESYRQLKLAMDKQGDRIQEHKFYSEEMNVYLKLLFNTYKWYEYFWTKLILFFSWLFSDYGRSINKPILGLILFNFLFYRLLPNSIEIVTINKHSQEAFYIALGEYSVLLNPVHKFNDKLIGLDLVWDLLSRVSASFFVYNLVRATRRFVK